MAVRLLPFSILERRDGFLMVCDPVGVNIDPVRRGKFEPAVLRRFGPPTTYAECGRGKNRIAALIGHLSHPHGMEGFSACEGFFVGTAEVSMKAVTTAEGQQASRHSTRSASSSIWTGRGWRECVRSIPIAEWASGSPRHRLQGGLGARSRYASTPSCRGPAALAASVVPCSQARAH